MERIKTYAEFINESVWGDIYKRGAGEQERREDEVYNKLDIVDVYQDVQSIKPNDSYICLYDDKVGNFKEEEGVWGDEEGGRRIEISFGDYEDGFNIIYRREKEPGPSLLVIIPGKNWDVYNTLMDIIKPTKLFDTKTIIKETDLVVHIFGKGKKTPSNQIFYKFVECLKDKI